MGFDDFPWLSCKESQPILGGGTSQDRWIRIKLTAGDLIVFARRHLSQARNSGFFFAAEIPQIPTDSTGRLGLWWVMLYLCYIYVASCPRFSSTFNHFIYSKHGEVLLAEAACEVHHGLQEFHPGNAFLGWRLA